MKEILILIWYYIKVGLGAIILIPTQIIIYLGLSIPRKLVKLIIYIFVNIYLTIKFLFYIIRSCACVILVTGLIAVFAELCFPSYMASIDTTITWKSVAQLMSAHHYQQAEYILESKRYLQKDDIPANKVLSKTLAKCYLYTGNYSKAEHTVKEAYKGEDSLYIRLYDLYERMGDKHNLDIVCQKINDIRKPNKFAIELANQEIYTAPYTGILSLKRIIDSPQYNSEQKFRAYLLLIKANYEYGNKSKTATYVHQSMKYTDCQESYYYVTELSDFCYQKGYVELAKEVAEQQLALMDGKLDDDNIDKILTEVRVLRCRKQFSENDKNKLADCCKVLREQISDNFLTMSPEQRESFAQKLDVSFRIADSLLTLSNTNELRKLCLANHIFKLSLLLRSEKRMRQVAGESGSEIKQLYDSLLISREELSTIQYMHDWRNVLASFRLKNTIGDLEEEIGTKIMQKDKDVHDSYADMDISGKLSDNESIVLLTDIRNKVYAFIIDNHHTNFVCVGDIRHLSALKGQNIYKDAKVAKMLWSKIEERLQGKKYVYYTVDRLFSNVSIPALKYNNQELGDQHEFVLLSNPGDIQFVKEKMDETVALEKMAIWGGIDYSSSISSNYSENNIQTDTWNYLYSSKQEADSIFSLYKHISPLLYEGVHATKKSFVNRSSKGDEVLHISTHGFYNAKNDVIVNQPMHNCGLVFAGANANTAQNDIGVLRAEEIENMDFSSCKLVALSACETGLGDVDDSEGTFGLQRAFKLAGVQYVLMSLRKVNDQITRDLMIAFYKNLKSNNKPDDALRKAQIKIKQKYSGSSEWASFVLLH